MKLRVEDRVSLIMTDNPICIDQGDVLRCAKDIMAKFSVRHLPVMKQNVLVGIISKSDIDRIKYIETGAAEFVSCDLLDTLFVSQVMTKNANTVQHDDTIKEATEILCLGSYHALPVMDGDDMVGIVTTTDLLVHLLKLYE